MHGIICLMHDIGCIKYQSLIHDDMGPIIIYARRRHCIGTLVRLPIFERETLLQLPNEGGIRSREEKKRGKTERTVE